MNEGLVKNMKISGIVNYNSKEVYNIFRKNAKRDFKDFKDDNPIGCKIEKNITTGGSKTIKCIVEITDYKLNEVYEITTSNEFSKCVSRYTFKEKSNGTTVVTLEEVQSTEKMVELVTLWIQRFLAKKNFKESFKNIINSLNHELKVYHDKLKRCEKKSV